MHIVAFSEWQPFLYAHIMMEHIMLSRCLLTFLSLEESPGMDHAQVAFMFLRSKVNVTGRCRTSVNYASGIPISDRCTPLLSTRPSSYPAQAAASRC